ncbi:MAG: protein kinase [Deltaproteobacteria bacterium]|nr:protein kinase [Deltaproteobacteria bacterium]
MVKGETRPTVTLLDDKRQLVDGIETVGSTLGRYTILECIGMGGMGVVFRARDPALARDLAIKVVRTAKGGTGELRVLREAQVMAQLRRPGVVPVYDVGLMQGGVYIVMPYLRGGTLGAWLRLAPRRWREVLDRFVAAGAGLAAAHAVGLVHRDFKPDNVLLDEDGNALVADFGLARPVRGPVVSAPGDAPLPALEVTSAGALVGTPAYMSPEQLRGEPVDARTDVFAYCVSLYEGLYGQRPFGPVDSRASTDEGAFDAPRSLREPPAGRNVPAWLRAAIVRGLAPQPDARWPSMDALLAHLTRRRRRPRRVLLAAGALVAAIAIVVATRAQSSPRPRPYRRARVTARGDVRDAALAPDGHHLAFLSMTGELLVRDLDSAGDERVVASAALAPAWSRDGHRVAYVSRGDKVHVVSLTGDAEQTLDLRVGAIAFDGDDLLVGWAINHRTLQFSDLAHRDAPTRSCEVAGDYRWMHAVVPLSDGTLLVGTKRDDAPGVAVDRVVHVDTRCAILDVVADLPLADTAPIAHDDHLVAETAGPTPTLVALAHDRDPVAIPAPIPDRPHQLVGIRPDGTVLHLEREASWRLLRAGPDHPPVELADGALRVQIAMAPRGDRFALVEPASDGTGGAMRVVDLATPRQRDAAIETAALAVGWVSDDTLVTLLARGASTVLVVEDLGGHHRAEFAVPAPVVFGKIVRVSADQVAYTRHDAHTVVAVDLRSGATHPLFDPDLGFTDSLSVSPRDGTFALWWRRDHRAGCYLAAGPAEGEWLTGDSDATPVWSARGDAIYLVDTIPPRIERLDLATRTVTPYVTDLSARSMIIGASNAGDRDLFVHLADPNADIFAQTPVP